ELFFELLPKALSEGRAFSRRRNGDLQRSALYHGGIVEIAESRNVHDIAEHAAPRRFFEYALVKFRRRCGGHNQEHSCQVARLERTLMPFDAVRLRPGAHLRRLFGRHHAEATGPSMDFATAAALASPVASKRIFRASKIVPMPMVMAQRGLSSPGAKNLALSSVVSRLKTFKRVREPMLEVGSLKPTWPLR